MSRKGGWILLGSGTQFWPLDPRPEDISLDDIRYALSKECRFGSQCLDFLSVAEHSINVSKRCDEGYELQALFHDSPEGLGLRDLPTPVKADLKEYRRIEHGIWLAVAERFSLPAEMHPSVKAADDRMFEIEAASYMPRSPLFPFVDSIPESELLHNPMTHKEAAKAFLNRYLELTTGAKACTY